MCIYRAAEPEHPVLPQLGPHETHPLGIARFRGRTKATRSLTVTSASGGKDLLDRQGRPGELTKAMKGTSEPPVSHHAQTAVLQSELVLLKIGSMIHFIAVAPGLKTPSTDLHAANEFRLNQGLDGCLEPDRCVSVKDPEVPPLVPFCP